MATIQIRDIPEDTYEALRKRARAEGKSLQSYMRDEVIAMATRSRKAAAFAELEAALTADPPRATSIESIVADLRTGRDERSGD